MVGLMDIEIELETELETESDITHYAYIQKYMCMHIYTYVLIMYIHT